MNNTNKISEPKYRPVLTSAQITHLISLCKKDLSSESISCISTLSVFEHKIKNNVVSAAYEIKPNLTLADKLGLTDDKDHIDKKALDTLPETLYSVWLTNPSMLNINELKTVRTYRYMNDLMTPEEEKLYESEILSANPS